MEIISWHLMCCMSSINTVYKKKKKKKKIDFCQLDVEINSWTKYFTNFSILSVLFVLTYNHSLWSFLNKRWNFYLFLVYTRILNILKNHRYEWPSNNLVDITSFMSYKYAAVSSTAYLKYWSTVNNRISENTKIHERTKFVTLGEWLETLRKGSGLFIIISILNLSSL